MTTTPPGAASRPRDTRTMLLPGIEPLPEPPDRRGELVRLVSESSQFRDGFSGWLHDNWAVWLRFEFEANKMRERGRRHYSARTIGEYIRHSTALRETKPTFKVNDHAWPDCARLYCELNPGAAGFFEIRGRH